MILLSHCHFLWPPRRPLFADLATNTLQCLHPPLPGLSSSWVTQLHKVRAGTTQSIRRKNERVNLAKPLHAQGDVIGLGQPRQSGGVVLAARAADSIAIAARAAP